LRDYLQLEFECRDDRLIDDWLLTVSLLGNDFIPSLFRDVEIREVGRILGLCFRIYREAFLRKGMFLTTDDEILMENFGSFLMMIGRELNSSEQEFENSREFAHEALDRLVWIYRYNKTGRAAQNWLPRVEYRVVPGIFMVGKYAQDFRSSLKQDPSSPAMKFDVLNETRPPTNSAQTFLNKFSIPAPHRKHLPQFPSLLRFPPVEVVVRESVSLRQEFPLRPEFAEQVCGKVVAVNWPYPELALVHEVVESSDVKSQQGVEFAKSARVFAVKLLRFEKRTFRVIPEPICVPLQSVLPVEFVPELLDVFVD